MVMCDCVMLNLCPKRMVQITVWNKGMHMSPVCCGLHEWRSRQVLTNVSKARIQQQCVLVIQIFFPRNERRLLHWPRMTLSHTAEWERRTWRLSQGLVLSTWEAVLWYICRRSRILFALFVLLGRVLCPALKRITRRLILSYKHLTLAWLVSC